ncbi:MAG: hypothetical protein QE263_04675 [Vampirovibrionales bacterium]|nr:hypothetical protein [Vampirovibrionales bacterium]
MPWASVVEHILEKPSTGAVVVLVVFLVYAAPMWVMWESVHYLAAEISASFRTYCIERGRPND